MTSSLSTHVWTRISSLIQIIFQTRNIPSKLAWNNVVMIPKPQSSECRGIWLTETIWKVISRIINYRITSSISFHNWVHGFQAKHGTGTAILDLKLTMTHTLETNTPLHTVLIDLRKSYDYVNRSKMIQLLQEYGVGEKMRNVIENYWEKQLVVVRKGKFFGNPFHPTRGVTQGDIISPTLFNIVVDTVVRNVAQTVIRNAFVWM